MTQKETQDPRDIIPLIAFAITFTSELEEIIILFLFFFLSQIKVSTLHFRALTC